MGLLIISFKFFEYCFNNLDEEDFPNFFGFRNYVKIILENKMQFTCFLGMEIISFVY